jgi:enoyl-CoA hydratase
MPALSGIPMSTPSILFEVLPGPHGSIGLITLNRPNQLNALNEEMCLTLSTHLSDWDAQEQIKAVLICGAGERAFCAGGDVRSIYSLRDQLEKGRYFFAKEYQLNAQIYHFKKPYIAWMDGITMGGGAGISIHGSHRIATEKLQFAMPETGIGFFTDVGATYFLSRLPGKIGCYLGLTGQVLEAAEALQIGLVDSVLLSTDFQPLLNQLTQAHWGENPHAVVDQLLAPLSFFMSTTDVEENWIQHRATIDRCFAAPSVEEIHAALDKTGDAWSQKTAQLLHTRSPTSLKVVRQALENAATLDFDACMAMEYRLACHFLEKPDFYEGVRAAVIDKDRSPVWQPPTLEAVDAKTISRYFDTKKA